MTTVDVLRCADGERKPPSRSSPLTSAFSRPNLSVTPFQLALLPRGRKRKLQHGLFVTSEKTSETACDWFFNFRSVTPRPQLPQPVPRLTWHGRPCHLVIQQLWWLLTPRMQSDALLQMMKTRSINSNSYNFSDILQLNFPHRMHTTTKCCEGNILLAEPVDKTVLWIRKIPSLIRTSHEPHSALNFLLWSYKISKIIRKPPGFRDYFKFNYKGISDFSDLGCLPNYRSHP